MRARAVVGVAHTNSRCARQLDWTTKVLSTRKNKIEASKKNILNGAGL